MLFLRVPWLYAILKRLSAFFSPRVPASPARMIEYHVPENFQMSPRLWRPEGRGKLIEFSARGARKSA